MVDHEVGDLLIKTGKRAHLGVVEGIGQEPHVDHEVRLNRKPMFEAEGKHVDVHQLLVAEL